MELKEGVMITFLSISPWTLPDRAGTVSASAAIHGSLRSIVQ